MRMRHAVNIAPRSRVALALVALVAGALALACGDGGSDEPAAPATATAAAPAPAAARRALIFEPKRATTSAGGPMNVSPASAHAAGRAGFSERKP